jgi:arylsulfatase A-like enzyme
MVVRYSAALPAGQMNRDLAHFTDWRPTLLNLCSVPNVGHCALDGNDLTPQLKGEKLHHPPRRFWQWTSTIPASRPTPQCGTAIGS